MAKVAQGLPGVPFAHLRSNLFKIPASNMSQIVCRALRTLQNIAMGDP
jgi:hypothetical protein